MKDNGRYVPQKGDAIKMHHWYGVVLDVFKTESGRIVLEVQTARNVFRKLPPEFIEVSNALEHISLATRETLEVEVENHNKLQTNAIEAMMKEILRTVDAVE